MNDTAGQTRQHYRGEAVGATGSRALAITKPRPVHHDRANPDLRLVLGRGAIPDNASVTGPIVKTRVLCQEGWNLHLDRSGEKTLHISVRHRRQWTLNRNLVWIRKRNHRIFVTGRERQKIALEPVSLIEDRRES